MEDNQIPSWRTIAILLALLFAVTTCNAQKHQDILGVEYDKQLHFLGGVVIGGLTHAVVLDVTNGDKLGAFFSSVVVTTIVGGLWEHYHADQIEGYPNRYIDFDDIKWGVFGSITASTIINISTNGKKKRELKQLERWNQKKKQRS